MYGNVKNKEVQDATKAWTIRTLQEVLTVWKTLQDKGLDFMDLENYLGQVRLERNVSLRKRQPKSKSRVFRTCPECGKIMSLVPIHGSRNTIEGYKSYWVCEPGCGSCGKPGCGYIIYNLLDVEQELAQLTEG